ncbi:hypothetical protein EJ04DRAFT_523190 [Polyplosphaeria fusca]|uniref:Uncharacterized protein n=1 Tax=Polyplosphaeria fusca TaxID=682080 RepID=A0A9P4QVZ0_9PLEO|nr:hypothetical protein EJ04DRAFT_523190 [Polyplosphaeria fusca]
MVPPRPSRCRERFQTPSHELSRTLAQETPSGNSQIIYDPLSPSILSIDDLPDPAVLGAHKEQQQPSTEQPSQPSKVGKNDHIRSDELANAMIGPHARSHQQNDQEEMHKASSSALQPQPRKVSSSLRRRPPVNGLALVRTTTEDGLPYRSDEDDAECLGIIDTDPIEDGQPTRIITNIELNTKSKLRKVPLSTIYHSMQAMGSSWKAPNRSLERQTPSRPTRSPAKRLQRVFCDGFVGKELHIPLQPRKVLKKPSRKEPKSATTGVLTLVKGILPDLVDETAIHFRQNTRTSASQSRVQHNALVLYDGIREIQAGRSDLRPLTRYPTDEEVRRQLASITAPDRVSEESDSSEEFEQGEDMDEDGSGVDRSDSKSDDSNVSDSDVEKTETAKPDMPDYDFSYYANRHYFEDIPSRRYEVSAKVLVGTVVR